jgi:hypothetical protein
LILAFSFVSAFSQEMDWHKTSNWKLYDFGGKKPFAYTVDSLSAFEHIDLNDDSLHYFLNAAALWPKDKVASWMGCFVVSCEGIDHKMRKIDVSVYGGFFYDEGDSRYYEVREGMKMSGWNILIG